MEEVKKCRECKNYNEDAEKKNWSCKGDIRDLSILCMLRRTWMGVYDIKTTLSAPRPPFKVPKQLQDMMDKFTDETDEGDKWKK